jgi:hypothetical protein
MKKMVKYIYKGKRKEKERDTENQNVSDLVCFFKQKIEQRGLSHLQLSLLKSVFLFNNVNSVDNETGPKRILCGVHFCAVVKILSEKESQF